MLEVSLIGKFEIRFNGEPIILSTHAAQSIFAFLILSDGIQYRREKLAGIFWPEVSEKKARTHLRQELWRIRKTLSEKTADNFIISDDMSVSFNPQSGCWLDVAIFNRLDDHSSSQELKDALALYRGELLPGFYEDWILEKRENLQLLFEKRIEQLLRILKNEKQWGEILVWAQYWIDFCRGSETAYQYLMLAYSALGERVKVLFTYERCVKELQELDLEPSEKTRSFLVQRKRSFNIPIPLTSFIGRERELEKISDLLAESRLVTLTGPGGIGKTRLAIQAVAELVDQFPDGIWFLDLAPLNHATLIPNTLASLLGLQESGDQRLTMTDMLINYFRTRMALVIFDNCEHLIESCATLVHTLLISCETLSILATSREPLRVAGESPHKVPSLDIPTADDELDGLMENESVRLFTERAASDEPAFTLNYQNVLTIAEICRRLDGIPLAIELAAARVAVLSVEQILRRLDDRLTLLAGGLRSSMPRHQTLRATIEWSYDLLAVKERILFRRLAVFSASWTLEAAEEVCSGDGILREEILDLTSQLVRKSLVVADFGEEGESQLNNEPVHYRRLEIIREFAREKLIQATEAGRLMDRHLQYFLKIALEIEPYLMGSDQAAWLDVLDGEFDDIRLGLEWAIANQKKEKALQLFSAMRWYWFIRCRFREGEEWYRRIQSFLPEVSMQTRAKALETASWFYYAKDDFLTTLQMYRQCLELYHELGDELGLSTTLQFMGVMEFELNHLTEARSNFEESLEISRRINNRAAMPRILMHLGYFAEMEGNTLSAQRYYEESITIGREVGEGYLLMVMLRNLGDHAIAQKNYPLAREYYQEVLEIGIRLKNKRTLGEVILNFAGILNEEGRYLESVRLQGFAESLFTESETLTESHWKSIRKAAEIPKDHLGEKTYQKEYDLGRSFSLDQAIGIALSHQKGFA